MALIKCPECSKEISEQAKMCLYCGYPIRKVPAKLKVKGRNRIIDLDDYFQRLLLDSELSE